MATTILQTLAVQLGSSNHFDVVERLDDIDYTLTLYTWVLPTNYANAYVLGGLAPAANPTTRTGLWCWDLRDVLGIPIVLGAGLGSGVDLLFPFRGNQSCPPGKLFVWTSNGLDPDLTAFAERRAVLYYQPIAQVLASGGSTTGGLA